MKKSNIYKLENGWEVYKNNKGQPMLHVFPIQNSIFRKEEHVIITEEIYNHVKLGERGIKELFKKFKLQNFIFRWETRKPSKRKKYNGTNTETKYFGPGFIATIENDKYFLEYLLAAHGGGSRKIEISNEAYLEARKGVLSISELFKKFDLYKFDSSD